MQNSKNRKKLSSVLGFKSITVGGYEWRCTPIKVIFSNCKKSQRLLIYLVVNKVLSGTTKDFIIQHLIYVTFLLLHLTSLKRRIIRIPITHATTIAMNRPRASTIQCDCTIPAKPMQITSRKII